MVCGIFQAYRETDVGMTSVGVLFHQIAVITVCVHLAIETPSWVSYCCSLGHAFTIPFSNKNGREMFSFGLPFTLNRFLIRHQMKTISYENTIASTLNRFIRKHFNTVFV